MSTAVAILDLERAVVGGLLLAETPEEATALLATAGELEPRHFKHSGCRLAWRVAVDLVRGGRLPDAVTVCDGLKSANGQGNAAAFVGSLLDGLPRVRNLQQWASLIVERAGPDPDAPEAEREPGQQHRPERASFAFEPADSFLERVEARGAPEWIMPDLLPDDGIAVWHGRPRSMKSLAALELDLAIATNTPAFGEERFTCTATEGSVLLLTEEDGERLLASRLRLMLAGRGLDRAPSRLRLLSRPGWNLETPADQAAVIEALRDVTPAPFLLTIDPARGSMPGLDKGPSDASGAVRFLRMLLRETSIRGVHILHHDVKPPRDGKDERTRAERASGGAVFSIADCPVNFERVSDREAFAAPSAYKVGSDPKPFRIVFESATPAGEPFRDFLRARVVTTDEQTEAVARAEAVILQVLDEATDWIGRTAIFEATRGTRQQNILAALRKLEDSGQVTVRASGRGGKAKEWRRGLVR